MAQLKDTTVTGDIAVSGSATIGGGAEITGGDLDLYVGTGDSPAVIFKRGTLTDNYNDWRIQDRGGWFYIDERGSGSTTWTNRMSINTTGVVTANTFSGAMAWDNITNKPALTTSDIAAGTDETNKLVSAKTLSEAIGSAGGGTVTSVTISGTSPISASGTVTSTGTLTVSHENSGVTEKTTQALYPFKVNQTGHITSVGTAVTVPTAGTTATAVGTTSSGGSATTWSKSDHVHSISSSTITSALGFTPASTTVASSTANGLMSSSDKIKLDGLSPTGQVQADWDVSDSSSAAFIRNKPTIPEDRLFIVTVTLTSTTAGTSNKSASEIATAAAAGKLPIVVTSIGTTSMVASLSHIDYDSDLGAYIAYFTYEDQSNFLYKYGTMQIHENKGVTINFINGYVPSGGNISNFNNDAGYLTQSTLGAALQANTALIYELVYHEPVWTYSQVIPGYYTIADTLANVVANISSDRKVVFRQSLDTGKYNYWQPWFNNPNSNKIGLYHFEKDDGKLYHVVFEPDSGGTGLTGTEVEPYYLNQHDPYAVGKIITTSSISDNPNNYLEGTWTLIDKEFTPLASTQLDSSAITLNTTNANGLDLYFSRTGHEIAFTGYLSSKVTISNTNLEMVQSITLSSLGTNAFNFTPILNAQSDSKHAIILMDMDKTSGRIRTLDVVVRGTGTSIASTSDIAFQAVVTCHYTDMLDSACGKFYWRRDS